MIVNRLTSCLTSPRSYLLVRFGMSLLFLVAGVSKLVNLDVFLMILEIYLGDSAIAIPAVWLTPFAIVLSVLEIVTAVGLLFNLRGFLSFMALQLVVFVLILLWGIGAGLDAPCGCFVLDDPAKPFHNGLAEALYRDCAMLLAVAYLYWWRWQENYGTD